jgi:DNA mismatch repair protein MutL
VAHERVLYERFRRSLAAERTVSQGLLEPLVLELAPAERLRLTQAIGELSECGFELVEMSGDAALGVTAIPATLEGDDAERLLRELASEPPTADDGHSHPSLRQRLLGSLAASTACKAAVKMHHALSAIEMESLMEELFACEEPFACPHGRPIVLKLADGDLERRFGRS